MYYIRVKHIYGDSEINCYTLKYAIECMRILSKCSDVTSYYLCDGLTGELYYECINNIVTYYNEKIIIPADFEYKKVHKKD